MREKYYTSRAIRFCVSSFLLLHCLRPTLARADDVAEARKRFDQAIALVEEGSFAEALAEFEKAYSLRPNVTVLFNIAMTHAALGHAVEAVDVLEKYLLDGGNSIPQPRREKALAELARQKSRIALLEFDIQPAGAEVRVDGNRAGNAPLALPVRVGLGVHKISVSREGYVPQERTVRVASDERVRVDVSLEPIKPPVEPTATLTITCKVPGVRISVNDTVVGMTPTPAFSIPAKASKVVFSRLGYVDAEQHVDAHDTESISLDCGVQRMTTLAEEISTTLTLHTIPRDATFWLDGAPIANSSRVPAGPHTLRVSAVGYRAWERDVVLTKQSNMSYEISLESEDESLRREANERWERRRLLAAAVAGAGVLAAGTSFGLSVWNSNRYERWGNEQESIRAAWQTRAATSPSLAQRRTANDDLGQSIKTVDKVSLGTAIGGAVLVTAGVTIYVTGTRGTEGLRVSGSKESGMLSWGATW